MYKNDTESQAKTTTYKFKAVPRLFNQVSSFEHWTWNPFQIVLALKKVKRLDHNKYSAVVIVNT